MPVRGRKRINRGPRMYTIHDNIRDVELRYNQCSIDIPGTELSALRFEPRVMVCYYFKDANCQGRKSRLQKYRDDFFHATITHGGNYFCFIPYALSIINYLRGGKN